MTFTYQLEHTLLIICPNCKQQIKAVVNDPPGKALVNELEYWKQRAYRAEEILNSGMIRNPFVS